MRRFAAVGLVVVAVSASGCKDQPFQLSVQPFFAASERPEGLAGRWLDEDGDGIEFEPSGDGFRVHLVAAARTSRARSECLGSVRLARVGDGLFWDLTAEPVADGNDVAEAHRLRLHSVARVRIEGDHLTIALLDPDWLAAALADGRVDLPHVSHADDATLLTAPTGALTDFISAYGDDPLAFRDTGTYDRAR
jgi:hypothetical protein